LTVASGVLPDPRCRSSGPAEPIALHDAPRGPVALSLAEVKAGIDM
jgi:hypothetical protein